MRRAHVIISTCAALALVGVTRPDASAAPSVDCTPIQETGYDQGVAFPLTVIKINGVKVEESLARAYWQMTLAAEQDGVTLTLVSGFRTMAQQQHLWNCYQGKVGNSCPGGCNSCNVAATPGYSKHQKGDAVDIATNGGTNTAYKWLKGLAGYAANGQAFGFLDTFNPPEPWHWVYVNPGPWIGPCDDGGPVEDPTACTPTPVAGAEGETFKDMPPGAFGKTEAEALLSAGITNGCAPDLFCPDCVATRAQAVTLLLRAANVDVGGPPAASSFEDVDPGAYYAPYVEKALQLGITQGCNATQFCPDEATTRKQFAKFLVETMDVPTVNPATATFTDVPKGDWGYKYVETLKELCITTGCSPTTFCPEEHVTRAMAAVFIARAFDLQDANDCIQYCDEDTCAGASFCENWSACSFADACIENGSQSRTCHDYSCSGPVTDASCDEETTSESQSCTRDTDGDVVEGWGPWSACVAHDLCNEVGERSRTRTVCAGGVAVDETQTETCAVELDPACNPPEPDPEPDVSDGDPSEPDAFEPADTAAETGPEVGVPTADAGTVDAEAPPGPEDVGDSPDAPGAVADTATSVDAGGTPRRRADAATTDTATTDTATPQKDGTHRAPSGDTGGGFTSWPSDTTPDGPVLDGGDGSSPGSGCTGGGGPVGWAGLLVAGLLVATRRRRRVAKW